MNRKRPLLYLGLASIFALFVLFRLPVSLLGGWLLPDTIRLEGAEGTVWHGRASALGLSGITLQQNLAWDVRWNQLLSGRLVWEIRSRSATDHSAVDLHAAPAGIELRNLQASLPLEPLLGQDARLKPLRLGGMLRLSAPNFSLTPGSVLSVRLENLFSALTPATGALGSSEIRITTQPDRTATWNMRPLEGRLSINGEGQLDLNRGTANGKLTFKPDEALTASLLPLLSLLQQQPGGGYTLDLSRR